MALINLRNALMAGKRLPYDAEVEYLESTGTQWIDTLVEPAQNLAFSCTFVFEGVTPQLGYGNIFGSRYSSTPTGRQYQLTGYESGSVRVGVGNRNLGFYSGVINTVSFDGAYTVNVNGVSHSIATSTCSPTTGSIALFGIRQNGVISQLSYSKIYSLKFILNGILLRDYIPVRKGTVGYLYDRVSGKLFGNAGTGDFVVGPDVVPVEWLQSDRYSYIQTNILPSAGLRTKLRWAFMRDPIVRNSGVFGSRSSETLNDRYWLNYDGHFEFGYGYYHATNVTVTPYEVFDVDFNYIEDGNHKFKINNSAFTASGTPNTSVAIPLFGRIVDTTPSRTASRGYYAEFIRDGVDVGKFLPVRVGTDATSWEGAMMDVLTRRIYRNAGTGAFTYGNDLRYPIPAE